MSGPRKKNSKKLFQGITKCRGRALVKEKSMLMSKHQPGKEDDMPDESFPEGLRLKEKGLPEGQMVLAMNRLLDRIRQLDKTAALRVMRMRWAAAAAVLLIMGMALWGYHGYWGKEEAATAFGEVKSRLLPDGTQVIANADTRLIWQKRWKDGQDREVWLSGEAFFHVSKTPMKSRFIVHTDHFDIIVTGTKFNAVSRPDESNVLLKEGSVLVKPTGDGAQQTTACTMMQLKPGDFVEYSKGCLMRRAANTDSVLAWTEKKLELDNTSLRELARIIREHYGVNVTLANDAVGDHRISAILPNDNLEVLLQALEVTGDFTVTRESTAIIIKDR